MNFPLGLSSLLERVNHIRGGLSREDSGDDALRLQISYTLTQLFKARVLAAHEKERDAYKNVFKRCKRCKRGRNRG